MHLSIYSASFGLHEFYIKSVIKLLPPCHRWEHQGPCWHKSPWKQKTQVLQPPVQCSSSQQPPWWKVILMSGEQEELAQGNLTCCPPPGDRPLQKKSYRSRIHYCLCIHVFLWCFISQIFIQVFFCARHWAPGSKANQMVSVPLSIISVD